MRKRITSILVNGKFINISPQKGPGELEDILNDSSISWVGFIDKNNNNFWVQKKHIGLIYFDEVSNLSDKSGKN